LYGLEKLYAESESGASLEAHYGTVQAIFLHKLNTSLSPGGLGEFKAAYDELEHGPLRNIL
jgi:hypothetical protein